jgi:choline dehydrogenase
VGRFEFMDRVDYVVVGGGSAGGVVTNRLSEQHEFSVLLLEAGVDATPMDAMQTPALYPKLWGTDATASGQSVPQQGLGGASVPWRTGRGMGGSSAINAMLWVRGNAADYDLWRDLGANGWGHDYIRPYFEKIEAGGMGAMRQRSPAPLSERFLESCVAAGIARNEDFNGAAQLGSGYFAVTQREGRRHSVREVYLEPARKRSNVRVEGEAAVTKLLFEGRRVIGVEYTSKGTTQVVYARKAVVLCAGALESPRILLRSGIGPGDEIAEGGIQPTHELPGVGSHLQDHLCQPLCWRMRDATSLEDMDTFGNRMRYRISREGPLTSPLMEAGAFVSLRGGPQPDIQLLFTPKLWPGVEGGHGFSIGVVLLHPHSRGYLQLNMMDPDYLSVEEDRQLMSEGVALARNLVREGPLQKLVQEEAEALAPESLHHYVGTCRMGGDDLAVVDSSLRVLGVEGLRIVDASVMPEIPSGNTLAPVLLIAERGTDLIRC